MSNGYIVAQIQDVRSEISERTHAGHHSDANSPALWLKSVRMDHVVELRLPRQQA
jgi:hypothetical protein